MLNEEGAGGTAWVLAIAQLAWHLTPSLEGIRYDTAGHAQAEPEGFDVIRQ